ncbi:MAG: hypothetical protein HFJ51_01055 [Clostridia bacterium]|nr:hypothetical protein [Clostridia bacterium]
MEKKIRKNKKKIADKAIPAYRLKKATKAMIMIFLLLVGRIGWIQFVQGAELKELASRQQTLNNTIKPKRGNIFDKNGKVLATSAQVDTITVNPSKIVVEHDDEEVEKIKTAEYKKKVAQGLADIFSLNYDEVLTKLQSTKSTEKIAEKVDYEAVEKLQAWMKENKIEAGINIDEDSKRYYPHDSLASHLIGFTGTDEQGLYGIELSKDKELAGLNGKIVTTGSGSAKRQEISNDYEQYIPVENGSDLYLTIDVTIQAIVEKYLKEGVDKNEAQAGSAILMDPKTGEILAMATYPSYNLNEPFTINVEEDKEKWEEFTSEERRDKLQYMWSDRNLRTYEPGSTFKLIVSAAALEEGMITTDSPNDFQCEGVTKIGDDTEIGCAGHEVHGNQSLRTALRNSCNGAFIKLGHTMGATRLYKYFEAFGLFEKTGVGLQGEISSRFHPLQEVGPVELGVTSFGQRFDITPIQLITAVSAIANGRKFNTTKGGWKNDKHRYWNSYRNRNKGNKKSNFRGYLKENEGHA